MLTRSHGIQFYHHALNDPLCGFSVLLPPRDLAEKFIKGRLILDESVMQVLYDQQSLLESFQEILAVGLSDNPRMGSNLVVAKGENAPRRLVASVACPT